MPSPVLADRYELQARIGFGGMSTVWRAFDRRLRREVAVKVLSDALSADEAFRLRFEREAHYVASLTHPHIVVIHDFGTEGDQLFIVMELVQGQSLRQILAESSLVPAAQVRRLATDVLSGLAHAHAAGIIHRDIKPANILISEAGVTKLADFGIAKAIDEATDLTLSGAVMGTVSYASPEQLAGQPLDAASDLYSLGCVLYECLSGGPPPGTDSYVSTASQREANSFPALSPEVPSDLADVVMRALKPEPSERFTSAAQMAEMLGVSGLVERDRPLAAPLAGPFNRPAAGPGEGATVRRGVPVVRPTGTVTLLFSDIEGSARLWEEKAEAMAAALRRHEELVRSAVGSAEGFVFATVGEAFGAAFASTRQAVDAARRSQELLGREPWPDGAHLRVRMALHTGECEERDGSYFGPALNRAAGLAAIAHGGQVVVSRATADVVRDRLPSGVALRDLGTHRLKDLERPEEVFQLEVEGLRTDFPPLRSLDNPELRHNLPEQPSSFVGRTEELAHVSDLIGRHRLVTLVGPGGTGKTRLSLQVAAELLDGNGDGVWLVELAPLKDGGLVASTCATVLGIGEQPERPVLETLADALRHKNLLMVLDNCEHLLDACAVLADTLVRLCPNVHLVCTSREPLSMGGEQVYRVPPLALPDSSFAANPEDLVGIDAVTLFCERAKSRQPDFTLDRQSAPAVISICRDLEGMPLALELAAARLETMSVTDVESRLDERFRLLTGGNRAALPRQQTLRALVDWSYELLTEVERVGMCRFSVFSGGWRLQEAEQVIAGGDIDRRDVLDLLSSLVRKSLVQLETGEGATRYRMLETIRQYAAEREAERGQPTALSLAHADTYLDVAEAAALQLRGPAAAEALGRLDDELDNMRAATAYLVEQPDSGPIVLRLAIAMTSFWETRGFFVEGTDLLGTVLRRPDTEEPTALRAEALSCLANLDLRRGSIMAARTCAEEGLAIARALGDAVLTSELLRTLVWASSMQGAVGDVPLDMADEAVDLARVTGDAFTLGRALMTRGSLLCVSDTARARADWEEALSVYRTAGDRVYVANTLGNLSYMDMLEGDTATARERLVEAIDLARALGAGGNLPSLMVNLGLAEVLDQDPEAATRSLRQSLVAADRIGDKQGVACAVMGLALCASATGDLSRAASLHGTTEAVCQDNGFPLEPLEEQLADEDRGRLQEQLGAQAYSAAFASGRGIAASDAVAHALGSPPAGAADLSA